MGNGMEDIGDMIQRALTYGIKLPKMSKTEADEYLLNLSDHINKGTLFRGAYSSNGITIETKYLEPILMIRIRKDTLEFLPISETSFFDSFVTVLEYVSQRKQQEEILKDFKIFVDEVDKDLAEDIDTEEVVKENSDDDFDWI